MATPPPAEKAPQTPAEPGAGTPPASYAAAILAEHAWRVRPDHSGTVPYLGVPTWGAGDAVASSHPGFPELAATGLLWPIVREGETPPAGYDQTGTPIPESD